MSIIRRYIIKPVNTMKSDLSSPTGKQKHHEQKSDYQTIWRLVLTYRPYAKKMIIVLLSIATTTALNLVVPLMIPLVYDDALVHRKIDHLILYVTIMIIATLLSGFTGVVQSYLSNQVGQYIMRDIRNQLYSHLQDMSLRFFTSMPTGEMQSRLSNDVNGAQSTVTDTFTGVITSFMTVVGTIIAMFYLSRLLTLLSFLLLPIFLFFSLRVGKMRRGATKQTQQTLASLTALMQETLSVSGILLIKAFGRKQFAQNQFATENQKLAELSIHQQMAGRWFLMFMKDFFVLTPVLLALVAGIVMIYLPGGGNLTIGKLLAFVTLQDSFLGPCATLITLIIMLQGSLALFDRLFEYLDLSIEIKDISDPVRLSPRSTRGEVTFKKVSFTYNKHVPLVNELHQTSSKRFGRFRGSRLLQMKDTLSHKKVSPMALSNLSFTIKPGQLVAFVGPSGAGKTTIMYLLLRLYDVTDGAVEIDGYNVKHLAMQTIGDLVGIVTQETYLFHASVRENLLYVCPDATEEEMVAATTSAAIHDRILHLEHGYDTVVGERGYKLSGGEKQRLAIARVLLKNPKILILDEATSALDTQSERFIQDALKPLMKSRTTIAIAHRLSTILAADLILVLDKGKIAEQGTHQELLKHGGIYANLYQQQFAYQAHEEPIL
jgi:ATP-binding cassette, subfamily B, bacterial